jgi:hypothetical protein
LAETETVLSEPMPAEDGAKAPPLGLFHTATDELPA